MRKRSDHDLKTLAQADKERERRQRHADEHPEETCADSADCGRQEEHWREPGVCFWCRRPLGPHRNKYRVMLD